MKVKFQLIGDRNSMKKIKNPLTIIGVFAGIAEVAGTAVLPLVSTELQKFFIWYVMGFPVLLVVLFFITLNKNPKVLYAPSDFADENNFMELLTKAGETMTNVIENNPSIENELKPLEKLVENMALYYNHSIVVDCNNPKVDAMNLSYGAFLIYENTIFNLHEGITRVGRGNDVDIQISDIMLSRNHFEIIYRDGEYYIKDLESANGTMLNGYKVFGEMQLCDNYIIKIGRMRFLFKYNKMK